MIYYWMHLFYIFIGSMFFWDKVDLESNLTRKRRVSILDCEGFRYMANSKYFYYMDLIRFEVMFRTNLYKHTAKKGLLPVLASQKIIYKKPLKIWTKFSITLVLEGWDDKWIYHRQVFEQNGQVCCIGFTKVAFWNSKELQSTQKIFADCGIIKPKQKPSLDVLNIFSNDYNFIKNTENTVK